MRGRILVMLLAAALLVAIAGPVNAEPADKPFIRGDLTCEDGSTYAIVIPGVNGSPVALNASGHGNLAVSRSVYIFETASDAASRENGFPIWEGDGLGKGYWDRTTWCWWYWDEVGWIGNDLMFVKK